MNKDLIMKPNDFSSSFLSCEKDMETILKKLFIQSRPYSDELKRLLVINTKDCLSNRDSKLYHDLINKSNLMFLKENGYIKFTPKMKQAQHEEVRSMIFMSYDTFTLNPSNPEFRDFIVTFRIVCHTDCYELDNYQIRPIKIMGYIDGILNKARLSGIGLFQFFGATPLALDEYHIGYTLMYKAIHGSDDNEREPAPPPGVDFYADK